MTSERLSCLITGVAGGIGRALVDAFTTSGYEVIALDNQSQPTDIVCGHYIQVDLAKLVVEEAYGDEVITKIRGCLDGAPLKVVVNNAAVQVLREVEELTRMDWRRTLDVNLLAPFFLVQGLLPELESSAGSVVNISSIHAHLTKPGFVAYATSKSALSGMTQAMAVDFCGRVRVNAIEPAAIDTEMLKAGFKNEPGKFEMLASYHPIGRVGNPEEVAATVLWLTSEEANFINGAKIKLDGAISSRLYDPD